ncbi:transposase [Photorhabdus temperata]|uniref:transposase n=1 Tax=Photorhabdus temperata TaxID=574560 RepID=UPI00038A1932|nr:IS630 family transposase [Photorhabdus temperata subsp. temperata M1021]
MKKIIQTTQNKNYTRRLMAILILHHRKSASQVAKTLCAERSSVNRWFNFIWIGKVFLPAGNYVPSKAPLPFYEESPLTPKSGLMGISGNNRNIFYDWDKIKILPCRLP